MPEERPGAIRKIRLTACARSFGGAARQRARCCPPKNSDWHHLRDKRFAVAHALRGGHERFLTELAKCICVNRKVHMLIHLQQKINCPEIIWRQVFQNLNTVSPTGSSESMQTCLPPGNFMNPMPRSTADTCQLPVPARPIFVFSWVGGHRYWIMLCTNDIQILSREATNTPDIPGLFIARGRVESDPRAVPRHPQRLPCRWRTDRHRRAAVFWNRKRSQCGPTDDFSGQPSLIPGSRPPVPVR